MTTIFFLFLWFTYFGVKGILFTESKVHKYFFVTITAILWFLMILTANKYSRPITFVMQCYLIFSGWNYARWVAKRRPHTGSLFSGINLITEDTQMSYFIFRPFILLTLNIVYFLKNFAILGWVEPIEISVESKDSSVDIYLSL